MDKVVTLHAHRHHWFISHWLVHVAGLLCLCQVMAEDYELLLNKLLNSLRRCQDYVSSTFGDTDLSGLEIVVDG